MYSREVKVTCLAHCKWLLNVLSRDTFIVVVSQDRMELKVLIS